MNKPYTGGCSCGAIRYEISAAPVEAPSKGRYDPALPDSSCSAPCLDAL